MSREVHVKYSRSSASRVHFAMSCVVVRFQMRDLTARDHLATSWFVGIFIVTPCMLSSYSIITPTTAHIQNLYNFTH